MNRDYIFNLDDLLPLMRTSPNSAGIGLRECIELCKKVESDVIYVDFEVLDDEDV